MNLQIDKLNDKPTLLYYEDNVFNDDELQFLFQLNYREGHYESKEHGILQVTRKQLWFQTENNYFCPLWKKRIHRWESNSYFEELFLIQNKVQNYINNLFKSKEEDSESPEWDIPKLNSCLINYYETGNQFIPPHKDSSISFGEYPTIICISYGDSRVLTVKNEEEKYSFNLKSNSIFIMAGSSQKYYTHQIERKEESLLPRYSLTFREFIL